MAENDAHLYGKGFLISTWWGLKRIPPAQVFVIHGPGIVENFGSSVISKNVIRAFKLSRRLRAEI